ncbi:PREDICTED: uncharacterized protein LOC105457299 isoform X2 [Wasmannia auropunctata]|uniref:uncharacterized protein LOC105457299 isoform X2 n=1 Tax=Wasmannia auropunctata TaxID=64793 RepID=UPI0005ED4A31|nr:PREDICTED: uncharacterized protein LOC105457299 isoform X2 [Wasmannia auropunctata]
MPKVKERDEQEALKLDEHFKRTLTHVRTYILNLRSVEEAHLCRIWLDKLNSTISQRNLRNEYLLELCRQLRAGTLEGVFKTEPSDNLLTPLPSSHAVCISSSLSELSDHGRNHQNCLTLSQRSDQRNYIRDKLKVHDSYSSSSVHAACHHNDNTIEGNYLKLRKYRIDVLIAMLENLRIENERLKKELTKCQGETVDNEAFRLRNRIKHLTTRAQTQSLAWKIRMLKKTIAKLRKLNDIIKHVYEKKLQHVITNKTLENKILQLQFQEQKSELCLFLCSEKQNELCKLIESLEGKYKTLLTAALENQRQEYFKKITSLEAELCNLKIKFGSKLRCI